MEQGITWELDFRIKMVTERDAYDQERCKMDMLN